MINWYSKKFNTQNIEAETDRSVLIKMPHSSQYDGYKFWITKKLVRETSNYFFKTFSFNDDFVFNLFKNGNGKYNQKEIIKSEEISAEEMNEINFI